MASRLDVPAAGGPDGACAGDARGAGARRVPAENLAVAESRARARSAPDPRPTLAGRHEAIYGPPIAARIKRRCPLLARYPLCGLSVVILVAVLSVSRSSAPGEPQPSPGRTRMNSPQHLNLEEHLTALVSESKSLLDRFASLIEGILAVSDVPPGNGRFSGSSRPSDAGSYSGSVLLSSAQAQGASVPVDVHVEYEKLNLALAFSLLAAFGGFIWAWLLHTTGGGKQANPSDYFWRYLALCVAVLLVAAAPVVNVQVLSKPNWQGSLTQCIGLATLVGAAAIAATPTLRALVLPSKPAKRDA